MQRTALPPNSAREGAHLRFDGRAHLAASEPQIVFGLKSQPELGGGTEIVSET